jgi:hypothetical protein
LLAARRDGGLAERPDLAEQHRRERIATHTASVGHGRPQNKVLSYALLFLIHAAPRIDRRSRFSQLSNQVVELVHRHIAPQFRANAPMPLSTPYHRLFPSALTSAKNRRTAASPEL